LEATTATKDDFDPAAKRLIWTFSDSSVVNDPTNLYEYLKEHRSSYRLTEQDLLLCVLEAAFTDYFILLDKKHIPKYKKTFEKLEKWFFKPNKRQRSHLYNFSNICDYLELDKDYILKNLIQLSRMVSHAT
jgi:hypothetical protein